MRANRDIANGLRLRFRFAFRFLAYTVAAFVVLLIITLLFFDDTSEGVEIAAGFVGSSFVMGAALGALISLGNLFFGNPGSRVSERLLNPAAFGGVAAGGLIGMMPFVLGGGSPSGGMTLGAWAIVGLILASPFGLVFGAIIAFKGNYPRVGDFIMGGVIGVLAVITSYAS